jgi:hypothetical protein
MLEYLMCYREASEKATAFEKRKKLEKVRKTLKNHPPSPEKSQKIPEKVGKFRVFPGFSTRVLLIINHIGV